MIECIAIDFETANSERSSICAVGWAIFNQHKIIESGKLLVKPVPFYFDHFNVSIHKIKEGDCLDKPNFKHIWDKVLNDKVKGKYVFCHNAGFDISCLRKYHDTIAVHYPEFQYFDSIHFAKGLWKEKQTYSLPIIVKEFNYQFKHHDAEEDAKACASIIIEGCRIHSSDTLKLSKILGIMPGILTKEAYKRPVFTVVKQKIIDLPLGQDDREPQENPYVYNQSQKVMESSCPVTCKNDQDDVFVFFAKNRRNPPHTVEFRFMQNKVYVTCSCPSGSLLEICRHKINFIRGNTKSLMDHPDQSDIKVIRERLGSTFVRQFLEKSWYEIRMLESSSFPACPT